MCAVLGGCSYGIGLSITTEDRITKYNWDKHTGGARAGEVGWGGGASTSWQVRHPSLG